MRCTRRGLLLLLPAMILPADDSRDIWDLFTGLAAALSEANLLDFMASFDRSMPGYGELEADVSGLLLQYDVQSSIDLLSDQGSGSIHNVELDWFLQLVNQQDSADVTRRRERVACKLQKAKRWTIASFAPVALFEPPRAGR
ncbi:MAG: hypothetical protein JO323_16735 [Acidobacteriia bacterium]|nr:hypothetical protein [Terriglobia bacterium]